MTSRTVVVTALAPAIWGTTYAVTSELLPPGRPLFAAAVRALPIGVVLVAAARSLPPPGWRCRIVVLGALNFAIFFALLFTGAYRLAGGVAATIGAVQPLLVVGLAAVLLREAATARRVLAAIGGLLGVALLVLDGSARVDAVGVAAAGGAAASMALGSVLTQRWGRVGTVTTFAGWQLAVGGLMLTPVALVVEGVPADLSGRSLLGYGYLAVIGGGLAYSLWFRGIRALGASAATPLALLSPVVATVLSVVVGDRITVVQGVGVAVVLASILAASGNRRTTGQRQWPGVSWTHVRHHPVPTVPHVLGGSGRG